MLHCKPAAQACHMLGELGRVSNMLLQRVAELQLDAGMALQRSQNTLDVPQLNF